MNTYLYWTLETLLILAVAFTAWVLIWHHRMSNKRHRRWMHVYPAGTERLYEDICWRLFRHRDHQLALSIAVKRGQNRILELIRG
jgi:hypothetical protein